MTKSTDEILTKDGVRNLINSIDDAIILIDNDFKIELYNSSALNILDRNIIQPTDNLLNIFQPIDSTGQPINLSQLIKSAQHQITTKDFSLKYDDDSRINLYLSISPIEHTYLSSDPLSGFVIIIRDITREKTIEEEKDEFISVVSHELRTPIAISEGNLSNALLLVDKTDDKAMIKETIDQAHKQILFLADLVNDLSILSRSERNVLEISKDQIDVDNLLHDMIVNYEPEARQKALRIVVDDNSESKLSLISTDLYVREILQNFITNAIKYSEKGTITISAKKSSTGVILSVKDQGIGISKADQERVFEKFFRSEDYKTRQASGTGLGLYVTLKLAKLLKASIKLKSQLNKGSTFLIDFPNL